jgi:hypothetical protein
MKSFYKYLNSALEFGETVDINRKPVFRSSAIFPVMQNNFHSTNILFLGYWLIKRKISEVTILITLRKNNGDIIKRNSILINSTKSYSIELHSLLKNSQYQESEFLGSIELEIFSTQDMVFPYPAFVLNYYGDDFNTCVHSISRTYNDFEDLLENEVFSVPETGFDIHATDDVESFISFVNGPLSNSNPLISYVITNSESKKFSGSFNLEKINPYETIFLKFKEKIPDLKQILKNKSGAITLKHNFEGFFPRFLVGNIQNSVPLLSFTHTYYDCSSSFEESDYWDRSTKEFYDCSVYIPIFIDNNQYTELVIYPNFSPSDFNLDIILYDSDGIEIHRFESFLIINSKDSKLVKINFNELIKNLDIDKNKVKSAHLISNFKNRIPSRLKFGLNVGLDNIKSKIPCNICFNSRVGNPLIENKPGSFHWCPLFHDNGIISIANFSPKKNYARSANVTLQFFNDDSLVLEKKLMLSPNSEFRIDVTNPEIKTIIQNEAIWVTIQADNPNIQGFYFNFHKSGCVAGDHFF